MSFSERWSAFWGDDVDKALAGKDFVIVTLRDYYYYEYAIDMRQIRELLKEEPDGLIEICRSKLTISFEFIHEFSPKCKVFIAIYIFSLHSLYYS